MKAEKFDLVLQEFIKQVEEERLEIEYAMEESFKSNSLYKMQIEDIKINLMIEKLMLDIMKLFSKYKIVNSETNFKFASLGVDVALTAVSGFVAPILFIPNTLTTIILSLYTINFYKNQLQFQDYTSQFVEEIEKIQELFINYTNKYMEVKNELEEKASLYTDFDNEKKYYYMANQFIIYYLENGEVYAIDENVQAAAKNILKDDLNTELNDLGNLLKVAKFKYEHGIKKCEKLSRKI